MPSQAKATAAGSAPREALQALGADVAEGSELGARGWVTALRDDRGHRRHHSRLPLLMTMKLLLASLLAASALFGGAPVRALPPLDELEIELQGEAQGWLNATCTYYGLGWLSDEQGRYALRRLTTLIKGQYLGEDAVNRAKKVALERDPGCQTIWPESGV